MGSVLGIISEETPKHEVVKKYEGYEVRCYAPSIVAEVTSDSIKSDEIKTDRDFSKMAFPLLAKYIGVFSTPENTQGNKPQAMAMTAPVIMSAQKSEAMAMTAPVVMEAKDSRMSMQFVLPSKYTMESVPKPTNEAVHIYELPPRTLAAMAFTGRFDMASALKKAEELRKLLEKDGVSVAENGHWTYAGYNPPWTLPWLRTNEVFWPVDHQAAVVQEAEAKSSI